MLKYYLLETARTKAWNDTHDILQKCLEHTENAAFVIFGYCGLEEGRMLYGLYLVKNDIGFTHFQHTKLYPFQNLRLEFILKVFFRKC